MRILSSTTRSYSPVNQSTTNYCFKLNSASSLTCGYLAIITISRGTFSGGQRLAEQVAKKLGYRVVSREVLAQAAKDHGVEEEALEEALRSKPGILERMSTERIHYLAYIRAALMNEIRNDNVVYHGNVGHLLLRDVPQVLKVRVVTSMEFRINAVMTQ